MRSTAYCRGLVDAAFKEERKRIAIRREDELKQAEDKYRKAFASAEAQRDERLRKINEVYAERMVEVQTAQQRDMREALQVHDRRLDELRGQVQTSLPRLDEKYQVLKERLAETHDKAWRTMADRWRDGITAAAAELDAISHEVDGYCPEWNDASWTDRALPRVVPPVVRSGTVALELAALPRGIAS